MARIYPVERKTVVALVCSKCGAAGEGSCACNEPYLPTPGERAAEAVAEEPSRSDRAIAQEIGVAPNTVRRARRVAPHGATETRIGTDGKNYPSSHPLRNAALDGDTSEPCVSITSDGDDVFTEGPKLRELAEDDIFRQRDKAYTAVLVWMTERIIDDTDFLHITSALRATGKNALVGLANDLEKTDQGKAAMAALEHAH